MLLGERISQLGAGLSKALVAHKCNAACWRPHCEGRQRLRLLPGVPFRKLKRHLHRRQQPLRHLLDRFERRRIDAALDQAQKIHRDPDELGEPLLADGHARHDTGANLAVIPASSRTSFPRA